MTSFETAFTTKIAPAMLAGINIQVTTGPVAWRVPKTMLKKHQAGFPPHIGILDTKWEREGAEIRFLTLVQNIPYLVDPYWQAHSSDKPGACFSIPLGEGAQITAQDVEISKTVESAFIDRVVRIVSAQRVRLTTRNGGQPMQDGVILEVYSMEGDLLWVNPFKTLDDAIQEGMKAISPFSRAAHHPPSVQPQQRVAQQIAPIAPKSMVTPIPVSPQPVLAPMAEIKPMPATDNPQKDMVVLQYYEKYASQKSGDALIALINRITGIQEAVVRAIILQHERNLPKKSPETEMVEDARKQFDGLDLDRDLLVSAIADMIGLPLETVEMALCELDDGGHQSPTLGIPVQRMCTPSTPVATASSPATIRPAIVAPVPITSNSMELNRPVAPIGFQPPVQLPQTQNTHRNATMVGGNPPPVRLQKPATVAPQNAPMVLEAPATVQTLPLAPQEQLPDWIPAKEAKEPRGTREQNEQKIEQMRQIVLQFLDEKPEASAKEILAHYEQESGTATSMSTLKARVLQPLTGEGVVVLEGATKSAVYRLANRKGRDEELRCFVLEHLQLSGPATLRELLAAYMHHAGISPALDGVEPSESQVLRQIREKAIHPLIEQGRVSQIGAGTRLTYAVTVD